MDPATTITAGDNCLATTVDGEVVVLNQTTGEYQGLQGIGPHVWEEVQSPTTVDAVYTSVEASFDNRPPDWQDEVLAFLEELKRHELIEVVDEG